MSAARTGPPSTPEKLWIAVLLLLPAPAWAHPFRDFVYALFGCFVLHLAGLIPWWRRWDFDLKLGYVVTFPVCLYAAGIVIGQFGIRALPGLYGPAAILFVPVAIAYLGWFWRRRRPA